ncbi:TetR/AcrR family transcriptional regulator [Pseudonocardia sp. NPDC046786]|uniref:TetR/AcrR family transcriptional regulator n=1 Tax=Pseudonocardia sp. NPDC046786 TaxID=3155471 RepID=UPI003402ACE6
MPPRQRLTARDWVAAALGALAEGGPAAVAVEPLAIRLGATKGSFYWHFANRDALLDAVLEHWERTETEHVIADLEREPDARVRLEHLLTTAMTPTAGTVGSSVELALQAAIGRPAVAATLARVTRRRLDYLTGLFGELGFTAEEARSRGTLAYTAYLGHAQLAHAAPDLVPDGRPSPGYLRTVIDSLTAPASR